MEDGEGKKKEGKEEGGIKIGGGGGEGGGRRGKDKDFLLYILFKIFCPRRIF